MNDLRKAAQLALEALEDVFDLENKDVEAIQALRQALSQPEWVSLTDEEKNKLVDAFYGTDIQRLEAIEAKLKEKNGVE